MVFVNIKETIKVKRRNYQLDCLFSSLQVDDLFTIQ